MSEGKGEEEAPVTINGREFKPLADGKYDAIVLGTGLKECVLSGLLATEGKKVLVVDRNSYYGGESASLNLTNLYQRFRGCDPPEGTDKRLGHNRDYNVDLIPKFIMAQGKLVKILLHTRVNHYLDFKVVGGSHVFKGSQGRTHKMPATEMEALRTPLMGFFQKRKFRNLLTWVAKYDEATGTIDGVDISRMTMVDVFKKFGLDENSQEFLGHAMALHLDEGYLTRPAAETIRSLTLYGNSLSMYGASPFIYPVYGLGGIPEGFSRLCALSGGVFMLNTDVTEILTDKSGAAVGVVSGGRAASAEIVVGDPSYFGKEQLRQTGRVARSICLLDHPIPGTDDLESVQIIVPQGQVAKTKKYASRTSDIYITCVSYAHRVAGKGKYVAIVSTTAETDDPIRELQPGLDLLGPVLERFDNVSPTYKPVSDGRSDHMYITESYDATSHFETTSADITAMYERITGSTLDLSHTAEDNEGGGGGGGGGD